MGIFDEAQVRLFEAGSVGVVPTDTVYGLVARASDRAAVERLYALKNREHKPGTLIAATVDQLVELGFKRRYVTAVEQFWPGPISVILPCDGELEHLHQGVGSLAVRLPSDERLRELLSIVGPLQTTSANHPGKPPAQTIAEARAYFGDRVDFYVDGGDLSDRQPSTVVRMIDDAVEVLRQGAVKINEETGEIEA